MAELLEVPVKDVQTTETFTWLAVSASIWLSVIGFLMSIEPPVVSDLEPVHAKEYPSIIEVPPVIAVAAVSNSTTLSAPTEANEAPVSVHPITISYKQSFVVVRNM